MMSFCASVCLSASLPAVKFVKSSAIRYDSVYLTCSKKLTGSQLSLPHGTNKKLKCETKNKTMNMIGPVQSCYHEGSPVGKRCLRWKHLLKRWVLSLEWKSNGVMDDESGDDDRSHVAHLGRVQQLTGLIGLSITPAYVRLVSCWTPFIVIQ